MTDYPDQDLIENLRWNIENAVLGVPGEDEDEDGHKDGNGSVGEEEEGRLGGAGRNDAGDGTTKKSLKGRVVAEGFLWGNDPEKLLGHLSRLDDRREGELEQELDQQQLQNDKDDDSNHVKQHSRSAEASNTRIRTGNDMRIENGVTSETRQPPQPRFDLLILADVLFNHSEHRKLVSSIVQTLKRPPPLPDDLGEKDKTTTTTAIVNNTSDTTDPSTKKISLPQFAPISSPAPPTHPRALVFFSPHRPWLLHRDMAFFDLAREQGLVVTKILERKMDRAMIAAGDDGVDREGDDKGEGGEGGEAGKETKKNRVRTVPGLRVSAYDVSSRRKRQGRDGKDVEREGKGEDEDEDDDDDIRKMVYGYELTWAVE